VVFQRKPEATLSSAQAGPKRVFRVLDRYGKEPEIRIFLSELSPQEGIIQDFYRAFRPILILDDKPAIPQPLVAERYPDQRPRVLAMPGSPAKLSIESYDWEGHAAKLFVEAPAFTAKVTLREYRAEN
jgi:hypothetical protein